MQVFYQLALWRSREFSVFLVNSSDELRIALELAQSENEAADPDTRYAFQQRLHHKKKHPRSDQALLNTNLPAVTEECDECDVMDSEIENMVTEGVVVPISARSESDKLESVIPGSQLVYSSSKKLDTQFELLKMPNLQLRESFEWVPLNFYSGYLLTFAMFPQSIVAVAILCGIWLPPYQVF